MEGEGDGGGGGWRGMGAGGRMMEGDGIMVWEGNRRQGDIM